MRNIDVYIKIEVCDDRVKIADCYSSSRAINKFNTTIIFNMGCIDICTCNSPEIFIYSSGRTTLYGMGKNGVSSSPPFAINTKEYALLIKSLEDFNCAYNLSECDYITLVELNGHKYGYNPVKDINIFDAILGV